MTDLDKLKNITTALLEIYPKKTEFAPIIIDHPVFESGIMMDHEKPINILEDKKAFEWAVKKRKQLIDTRKTPDELMFIIRKPYLFAWLDLSKDFLSADDFSRLFGDAWVLNENANQDVHVSIRKAAKWFKEANKASLMTESELEVYNNLPEEIELYRGVAKGRKEKGMSWTTDLEKAEWFSQRFGKEGYILKMTAKKKDILAYFDRRDEFEYVVYPKKYETK